MVFISSSRKYDVPILLVVIFSKLVPEFKIKFTELLNSGFLDNVIHRMIIKGVFPVWFNECMEFDPLYGRLDGLRWAISTAMRDLLINMNATTFRYELNHFNEGEIKSMISRIGMSQEEVSIISKELNHQLITG